jgi:hypothetical protein
VVAGDPFVAAGQEENRPHACVDGYVYLGYTAVEESGEQTSSGMVLVVVLWALVLIPLAWGVYQTLTGVVALFAGG